ncbi:MAG: hypothetical protein IJM92_01315 [Fibrobacter sp.]|uniref:hypothetical protein n=1 Tax=Fibrobacter sp. TaxID=35828 RepID=UPI0025BCD86F|nr:hypothetical protein [Fibrobacter sp.]MBQ7078315.1 hypothetical protein [Fibrobacter sp.]
MKKTAFLLGMLFCLYSLIACSDPALGSNTRYKLYPTKNMWTFLKLDTETGKIWQVHFSIDGKDSRFEIPLNSGDIAQTLKKSKKIGRYELYQTQNMYNFILLDQLDGHTYQIQWSHEKNGRLIMQISD